VSPGPPCEGGLLRGAFAPTGALAIQGTPQGWGLGRETPRNWIEAFPPGSDTRLRKWLPNFMAVLGYLWKGAGRGFSGRVPPFQHRHAKTPGLHRSGGPSGEAGCKGNPFHTPGFEPRGVPNFPSGGGDPLFHKTGGLRRPNFPGRGGPPFLAKTRGGAVGTFDVRGDPGGAQRPRGMAVLKAGGGGPRRANASAPSPRDRTGGGPRWLGGTPTGAAAAKEAKIRGAVLRCVMVNGKHPKGAEFGGGGKNPARLGTPFPGSRGRAVEGARFSGGAGHPRGEPGRGNTNLTVGLGQGRPPPAGAIHPRRHRVRSGTTPTRPTRGRGNGFR